MKRNSYKNNISNRAIYKGLGTTAKPLACLLSQALMSQSFKGEIPSPVLTITKPIGSIMLKFSTRQAARSFALKSGHKTVDLGAGTNGKRWAVKVL